MGSVKPIYHWYSNDYDHSWVCRMTLPLSNLGISGDGTLCGNEESIACYDYKVNGNPDAKQRKFVEDHLYREYELRESKPPRKKVDRRRMILLCKQ